METAYPPCPIRTDWKALYKAAVHETDGSIGSHRIAEAERAISHVLENSSTVTVPSKKRKLLKTLCAPCVP